MKIETRGVKAHRGTRAGVEEKRLRWQIRSVGKEGFEFGLDRVTPISWKIVRSREDGKTAYAYDLPEPQPHEKAYADWLKSRRGKTVIYSVIEARNTVIALRDQH